MGDADLKACGVSAEAEAHELALTPGDAFLIAATDGLWDRLSNEEAIGLVQVSTGGLQGGLVVPKERRRVGWCVAGRSPAASSPAQLSL